MPSIARGMMGVYSSRALAAINLPPADFLAVDVIPGVTGLAIEGQVLTATAGEYSGLSAIALSGQQFLRDGLPISGATATTYTLTASDVGALITRTETATNAAGSVTAVSNPIGPITALAVAPTASTAPTISDTTPTEGQTLTITAGTYTGTAPITVARWMQRSTTDVQSLGTGTTYTVQAGDVGSTLRVREVATNLVGSSANNFSSATSATAAASPTPIIGNQSASIPENASIGATLLTVTNTGGAAATWAITAGNTGSAFAISSTGVITVAAALDYETTASYSLTVQATNDAGSDTATITATITDVAEGGEVVLTSVVLDGTSQSGRSIQYTTGMLFVEGDLATTDDFSLRNASTLATIPTQIDVLSTWGDGSVKHAHVTASATLSEGARLTCDAVKGLAGAAGSDLSMATLLSGRTLSITITPSVGAAWTQSLYASLTADRWLIGPLCVEARQVFNVPSAQFTGAPGMRVIADITAFSNGDIRVFLQIANDKSHIVGGGRPVYAASVTMDGNIVWSFASQTHAQYTALCKEFGTTSAGALLPERAFVMPEVHYMGTTGIIDDVDTDIPLAASVSTNLATILASPTYNTLKDRRSINASLGAAGDAQQIGWYAGSQAAWLASSGTLYNAARVMRGWAESTPALWPHRFWADDVGQWILPDIAPNFTSIGVNGRTSPAGTPWISVQGPPADQLKQQSTYAVSADHGHQGPWYYLPWIIEARRAYADGVAAQGSWAFVDPNSRYNGFGTPNYSTGDRLGYAWLAATRTVNTQARSCGHDFRAIINAAKSLPDAYPAKSGYTDLARGQINWINTIVGDFEASLNTSHGAGNWEHLGALPFDTQTIGHAPFREVNPAWQQDFIRKAVVDYIRAKLAGYDTYAKTAIDWLMRWHAEAVNRTTGTWKYKNAWKQGVWAPSAGQQRYATLDEMQTGLEAAEQTALEVFRTFTVDTSTDRITMTTSGGSSIQEGKPCGFTTTGTLPAPLVAGTKYFIKFISQQIVQVATSSQGSAINITDTGSGVHTINVYARTNAHPDWIANAYGGSGDYMRRWRGMVLQYLELPNPDPDIADALHRLISERGEDGDLAGMPLIWDGNIAADPRVMIVSGGTRLSFAVAPVVRPGQSFSTAGDPSDIIGVVRTSGGLPRASTENGTDAFAIVSGDGGGLFTISSGGVLARTASGSVGAGPYALSITAQNTAGTSAAGTVTVTIT